MNPIEVTLKHNERTLTALAHKQYDLFCGANRNTRTILAMGLFILGVSNVESWWGLLMIAYGSFLLTGKYNAANRTARQITEQLKASGEDYPSSKYIFDEHKMRIITLPNESELDPLPYSKIAGLGEDATYFYIFQNEYGGYLIPKEQLGDRVDEFKILLEQKSGKFFITNRSRFIHLRQWMRDRQEQRSHL